MPEASQMHRYPPRRGPDLCARCGTDRTVLTPNDVAAYSDLCARCWAESRQDLRVESAHRVVTAKPTMEDGQR